MDSLTHTVLGACIGEVIGGKKIGKQAMFWGALANNIPDIDVITSLWMNQADSLLAHRGFTHSILFAVLFSILLARLLTKYHKSGKMHFRDWLIMFGSGMFVHIFIDALTSYGTGWFEPFSHYRVTMNVMFVADPFYTIFIFISFLALLILRSKSTARKHWARLGIFASSLYIVYAFFNKSVIDSNFKDELKRQNISSNNYFTTPAPLNNFLWYVVAGNDSGFYYGYYSFFDKSKEITLQYRPRHDDYLMGLENEKDIIKLKRFSAGYYTAEEKDDTLYLNDLRFGTVGGWENPNADFVFRYCLAKDANNDLVIQRGRFKSVGKEAFTSLYNRICGK